MSDQPLYHHKNTPRQVNPIKLVPQVSLATLEKKKANTHLPSTIIHSTLAKEKKITKPDKRKHYRTKMCPHGRDCRKRFTCTYAHSEHELRKPFIKRTKPCLLYQRGKCSFETPEFGDLVDSLGMRYVVIPIAGRDGTPIAGALQEFVPTG